ncbi:MAG: response regulator [Magnetococcales bacterium]|nr:response regulator [Magnetococcales bacterium]
MAHILVIDDDDSVRLLVRTLLLLDGHHFTGASGGGEGLRLFSAQPDGFDLVITDLSMPDIHGQQVVATLLDEKPDLTILVFSGSGFDSDWDKGLKGIQSRFPTVNVMTKPFTAKEFRQVLSQILSSRSSSDEATAS